MSAEQSSALLMEQTIHNRLQQISVARFGVPEATKLIRYEHIERNPYQRITGVYPEGLPTYVYEAGLPYAFWVRLHPNKARRYQLLHSARWLSPAYWAGHDRMPCTIIAADDATCTEFGWLEALLHGSIPLVQQATGIAWLLEHANYTIVSLAETTGHQPDTIGDRLALLGLPTDLQLAVEQQPATLRAMVLLGQLDDPLTRMILLPGVRDSSITEEMLQAELQARSGLTASD